MLNLIIFFNPLLKINVDESLFKHLLGKLLLIPFSLVCKPQFSPILQNISFQREYFIIFNNQ